MGYVSSLEGSQISMSQPIWLEGPLNTRDPATDRGTRTKSPGVLGRKTLGSETVFRWEGRGEIPREQVGHLDVQVDGSDRINGFFHLTYKIGIFLGVEKTHWSNHLWSNRTSKGTSKHAGELWGWARRMK